MAEAESQKRAEFEEEALVHLDPLYGLALRLTGGDESRAEDLVQEAVLKAYRSWDKFETGTNCRAWLMTILRNTFINEFRRRKKQPRPVEYDEVAERETGLADSAYMAVKDSDPEGAFFRDIIDDEVVDAIEELDEQFRIPLVLSDLEGMSYQEIAEALDLPVGTVKSRLFRARRRLQKKLYEYAVEMGYL